MIGAISVLAPELSVLLVTRQAATRVASLASMPVHEATLRVKHGWTRSGRTAPRLARTDHVESPIKVEAPPAFQNSNPRLAAAHRVGMDVLTDYGSSQEAKSHERDGDDNGSGVPSQTGTKLQPEWGSIAIGAIEHLGRVGLDHDHDR